jgi:hypothetical protein
MDYSWRAGKEGMKSPEILLIMTPTCAVAILPVAAALEFKVAMAKCDDKQGYDMMHTTYRRGAVAGCGHRMYI